MKHRYIYLLMLVVACGCMFEEVFSPLDNELSNLIPEPERFILPGPDQLADIPQSPENPLTPEKIALGNLLFFEPAFSTEAIHSISLQTFTCSSCHIPERGFRAGRLQGIADGGKGIGNLGAERVKNGYYLDSEIDAQGARPLAVINTAFVTNSMWNGSFGSKFVNEGTEDQWGVSDPATAQNKNYYGNLEGQNIEGLKTHRMKYTKSTITQYGYKEMFDAAFPDLPEDIRYSNTAASFALSAFLRSMTTTQAPFQRWLKGDYKAMSDEEKRGAILFFGKAGCVGCHSEKNLGSIQFAALGVDNLYQHGGLKTDASDLRNKGRGGFTNRKEDEFKFRVPQLYNLGDGGPYFHGSSKQTLEEVVEYFNNGIPENPDVPAGQIHPLFRPLGLTEAEKKDLVVFLKTGLRDPDLLRFKPSNVKSGMCFPNNDILSRHQTGCE